MGKQLSVFELPEDILDNLNARLVASNFSPLDGHVKWLEQQGIRISRSALHRYISARRGSLLLQGKGYAESAQIDARLQCLEIAATQLSDASPQQLIEYAETLLEWACVS